MTLSIGNKLIKCNDDGTPVENEGYVLFEVIDLSNTAEDQNAGSRQLKATTGEPREDSDGNTVQFVKVRKIR